MDGVIIINKHVGCTSSDICLRVKKILGLRKVGHVGTLDPLATGVLPLCVNDSTKLVQFLVRNDKEYIATLRLGIATDTQDSQGQIVQATEDIPNDTNRITEIFREFAGDILQTPPMFSALKHNGVPLYKIARTGKSVPREQRKISIYDIEILNIDFPHIQFRAECSHGTYIRTLCHDIGERLGCGAHMTRLARVRNGPFHIRDAVTLEELESCSREEVIARHLIPPKDALRGLPEVIVSDVVERKIRNGAHITINDINRLDVPPADHGQQLKVLSFQGSLIGVVETLVREGMGMADDVYMKAWKTLRVFADSTH